MKIKKLLFATHFSDLRFDALKSLMDLKKVNLEHVVFLNVIEREKVAMRRGTGYQKKTELKLKEKANIRFIDWAETLFEKGMEVGVHIVVGDFTAELIKTSIMEEIDLIVLSLENKTKIKELSIKANFSEIFQRVKKPILLHKNLSNKNYSFNKPFSKPLLVINEEFNRNKIFFNIIINLAGIIDSLDIICIIKEKKLDTSSAMKIQKTRKEARKNLDHISLNFEKNSIKTRSHIYIGNSMIEIEKATKECDSSMIIIGFMIEKFWKAPWKKNVSQKIAEKSPYPTLLIPF